MSAVADVIHINKKLSLIWGAWVDSEGFGGCHEDGSPFKLLFLPLRPQGKLISSLSSFSTRFHSPGTAQPEKQYGLKLVLANV